MQSQTLGSLLAVAGGLLALIPAIRASDPGWQYTLLAGFLMFAGGMILLWTVTDASD
jgi:hypothetical protein